MSIFERQLSGYRLAETHFGDDLQAVAARELGDANRWVELVWLNNMRPPYIVADAGQVTPGVVLAGSFLKVPAPTTALTDATAFGQVYERDVQLVGKKLKASGGDLAVVAGSSNLVQQLQHRIDTPRGQARRYPKYGCLIWTLKGQVNGPIAAALGAQYVNSALKADYRVSSTSNVTANASGDVVQITATAIAIDGGSVDVFSSTAQG